MLICGDNIKTLKDFDADTIDSCITDPPYGMEMADWDHNVTTIELLQEIFRVLKPGAFCLSFCSPQLYHRMASNVEDANFNIIDQIMWMTTTKMAVGNKLKPAHEPIVVAQKPFKETIKKNVEEYGVGRINTDTTRVPWDGKPPEGWVADGHKRRHFGGEGKTTGSKEIDGTVNANPIGRYPMNIIGEVEKSEQKYFYAPRVTSKERKEYNDHPTPKPINLMRYLVRLYSPVNGIVLDPFVGSGSTGIGALLENREFIGIDLSEHYINIAEKRIVEFLAEKKEKLMPYDEGNIISKLFD